MTNHKDTIVYSYWFDKTKHIENIPQPACIIVDNPNYLSKDLPNVYIQVEPNIILNYENYLIENYQKYHTIITYNQNVLDKCPNAISYIYGTTWVNKNYYNNIDINKKQFHISVLSGTKLMNSAPGHKFRQIIHHNQHLLIDFPITFFRSSQQKPIIKDYGNNPLLEPNTTTHSKNKLFEDFQFAIVIENSKQLNYFTEKIMDCILTKTIPIYWGCPNIADFFDTSGWIILETNTVEELSNKMRCLTKEYYSLYKDIIEKNHKTAQKYTDVYQNINNAIHISN